MKQTFDKLDVTLPIVSDRDESYSHRLDEKISLFLGEILVYVTYGGEDFFWFSLISSY